MILVDIIQHSWRQFGCYTMDMDNIQQALMVQQSNTIKDASPNHIINLKANSGDLYTIFNV